MTVKQIITEYLKTKGYDGLLNKDFNCSCDMENLLVCCDCDGEVVNCRAAYKVKCDREKCKIKKNCNVCDGEVVNCSATYGADSAYCMQLTKGAE
jgi:hypothetical protein